MCLHDEISLSFDGTTKQGPRTATANTTSACPCQVLHVHRWFIHAPRCPSSTCTTSRLCRSHTYILLSSEPEMIHLPPVTLKQEKTQYTRLVCPVYVLR